MAVTQGKSAPARQPAAGRRAQQEDREDPGCVPGKEGSDVDDAFFARYQHAWSVGDADSIAEMMTPDGLYEASFGPEPWGQRFNGRDAIRAAVVAQQASSSHLGSHVYGQRYVCGNHGFSTWTSDSVDADGNPTVVYGCDFYEFRDGLVSKKIAFRKARG
jgi:ketosteroid isomerase-like protein